MTIKRIERGDLTPYAPVVEMLLCKTKAEARDVYHKSTAKRHLPLLSKIRDELSFGPRASSEENIGIAMKMVAQAEGHKRTFWSDTQKRETSEAKKKQYEIIWEHVKPLLDKGYTHSQAGQSYGCSKTMVTYLCRRNGYSQQKAERLEYERKQKARRIYQLQQTGMSMREIAKTMRMAYGTCYALRERYAVDMALEAAE